MRKDTWTQMHTCDLTEVERDEAGRASCKTVRQLTLHNEDAKARIAELNARRQELDKEVRRLATAADTGKEERLVECYETPNLTTLRVESIRMDTGEAFASREMDADERKKARQREFEYSPEIVKAAESEKRAQAARKKVTDIKSYERRRELNKIDADRDKGIDDHVVDAMAQAIIERATRPIAADTLERDLSASLGSVDNPLPLPEPITGEEEPERPGAEPRDLYATAETDGEAPEDAPERGSALNPTPLDPPPQGDRH